MSSFPAPSSSLSSFDFFQTIGAFWIFFYANCGIKSLAKVISRGYNQFKVKKILDLQHINTSTHQQLNMASRCSSQSSSSSSRRSPICGALPPARGPTHPNCSPQSLTSPSLPSSSPSLSLSSSSLTLNTNIHVLRRASQSPLLATVDVEYGTQVSIHVSLLISTTLVSFGTNVYYTAGHEGEVLLRVIWGVTVASSLPGLAKFTSDVPPLMPFLCILTPKGMYPLLTVYEYGWIKQPTETGVCEYSEAPGEGLL